MTKRKFETEVSDLLQLIIHSLYSHKEIFLRELISNASDALDKLRHLTLVDEKYKPIEFAPRVDIEFDSVARTLTISDSGLGMNQEDLVEQIGTIARSGTRKFVEQLTGDKKADSNLIGQFGVGFYSSFMVANFVEIISRKAGEEQAWSWRSNGQGDYEIGEAERDSHGTTIELRLNEAGQEFANRWSLDSIVKKYSNHISYPIFMHFEDSRFEGEGDDRKEIKEPKVEQVNDASALWKRSKRELKEEDYQKFYQSMTNDSQAPMLTLHNQAEGTLEYTTLFFVPKETPADIFHANYRSGVKLYVKRVFITDDSKELLPPWLRFVRGIIDSEDLPLNVSREILQQNPIMESIRTASVKKLLEEFARLAEDEEKYLVFHAEFGRLLKEGLYTDYVNRDKLLELVRYKTTRDETFTSLAAYQERMGEDQKVIYYLTGEKEQSLRQSPLLEAYREKKIEVLLLDDEVDEIVISAVGKYKELELVSINRSDAAEGLKTEDDKAAEREIDPLIARIKEVLGDQVKEVKASTRLSDSPCCLVVDGKDPSIQMQALFKSMGQENMPNIKPILEVNPNHEIIHKLEKLEDETLFAASSRLLLEQAMLLEGVEMQNPAEFVQRLNTILNRAL